MRVRLLCGAASVALALALVPAANAGPVHVVGVDTGGYPELRVTVVAPSGSAQPALRENGTPVTGLQALNLGRAKSVSLLVDRSQSMRGRSLADAVAAARAFVSAKGASDRIQVIAFGHQAIALTGFSSSTADADAALRHLTTDTRPGTALWDAVALASRRLAKESQPGHVIIVLTDGQDVSSVASLGAAVNDAHEARASVYPIGIAGRDFTPEPLRTLADRTGGSYHQASSSAQLTGIYAWIGRVLSHTWELRYPTAARPGESFTLAAMVSGVGSAERPVVLGGLGTNPTVASPSVLPSGAWASPVAPVIVATVVGFLILLACGFVFASRHGLWVRARLEPHLGQVRRTKKARRKRERRAVIQELLTVTERTFANVKQFRSLQRTIERADLPLRASELLYMCIGSGIFFGLFAAAIFKTPPLITFILMAGGSALPVMFVKFKAGIRIKAFDNQLPELLITISASLKAGHSFRHAVQAVVDEGAQPTAKEFTRVLSETQLGRSMDSALADMSERVGSKNLRFVITAVTIQRQVGGSLAGLFDMIAETVRNRQQFARKISGLTAMGRMSAYVLIGLPFFIALAVTAMNPSYMHPLYYSSAGHMLILIGLAMMSVGTVVLRKIVAFKG